MKILVIGGTGTVGSATVQTLTRRPGGAEIRVMTRRPEDASLPAGADAVAGDLGDPDTLETAFQGIDRVCLITPLDPNESTLGKAAVSAARDHGVRRIVFLSVHQVESCPQAPHFRSKIEIEGAIKGTGIPFTVVRPNNFFENDLWLRDAILGHGVYPQPLGSKGVSRIGAGDIAEAIANALLARDDTFEGKTYPLVGQDALTGEQCARIWNRHVDRTVTYGGDDLDAWADQARQAMPDWMVEDLRIMYRHFQENGLKATDADLARQHELLDRQPLRYEDWVEQTAQRIRS